MLNVENKEINYRDEFSVEYMGQGEYFLESVQPLCYDNVMYKVCISVVDKYKIYNSLSVLGQYVINVVLVPYVRYIKPSAIKSIMDTKYGDDAPLAKIRSYITKKSCISIYDLYSFGITLPLYSPISIELSEEDVDELELLDISIVDTTSIKAKLDSIASLIDFFKIRLSSYITKIDDDIKEYVFNNLK